MNTTLFLVAMASLASAIIFKVTAQNAMNTRAWQRDEGPAIVLGCGAVLGYAVFAILALGSSFALLVRLN